MGTVMLPAACIGHPGHCCWEAYSLLELLEA